MADAKNIWASSFSESQRNHQELEDKEAWRAIAGILMGIITIGLCLSFLTIFLVTR